MLPEALDAYVDAAANVGNPSSLHAAGRCARRLVEESRERIAAVLGARPSEVVFTSGGTESDNRAAKGLFWAAPAGRRRVVASSVEHHAVLDAVEWLGTHDGATVDLLPVSASGRIDVQFYRDLLASHADEIAVISAQWANNEIGTIQPVPELAALAAQAGIPFHTDAVQAVGQIPVDFATSGAAALTLTGHKLGGPIGVGALLLGRDVECTPLLHGGGQEPRSPAARATRCSCSWTRRASPAPPARHARPAWHSRPMSCWRWARATAAPGRRSASPWATRPRRRTSTHCWPPCRPR